MTSSHCCSFDRAENPDISEVDTSGQHPDDLCPPELYRIVADNDTLQPSNQQLHDALNLSREYWYRLSETACYVHGNGVKPELTRPRHMLWKVPSMHGGPHTTHALHIGASPSRILCLQASVNWQLDETTICDRARKDRTDTILLHIGTKAAVPYSLNGKDFSFWIEMEGEKVLGPNYLAVLTLGWCYVLSARLLEIYGKNTAMRYMESKATAHHEAIPESTMHTVDIGEVSDDTAWWWLSVLACGEGWKAVIKQSDGGEFLAPWSVIRPSEQSLAIKWRSMDSAEAPSPTPLSSKKAFEALCQFAVLHNLGSQFFVALTVALTIPTHNCHGSTLQLPQPSLIGARCPATPVNCVPQDWATLYDNISYYITLSCNPETIISSLCGSFWEPGVPCNLVSPWLHPILSEVPEKEKIAASPGLYSEILAIMNGIRRPTIAALWLGAAAGGLTPMILRRTRRGRPPLDPVAFYWTGCPQSFMDIPGTGPYLDQSKKQVWRADVWRLLHLPTTEEDDLSYNYPPRTPWEPCGKMQTTDCALRVVSHLNCPRHQIQYHHWNWEVENSPAIEDEGFSATRAFVPTTPERGHFHVQGPHVFPQKPLDQEASEQASIDIFRWFIFNGEGFPPGKFYRDEWLACLADDEDTDEEDEESDDKILSNPTQAGKTNGLEQWLNTLQ